MATSEPASLLFHFSNMAFPSVFPHIPGLLHGFIWTHPSYRLHVLAYEACMFRAGDICAAMSVVEQPMADARDERGRDGWLRYSGTGSNGEWLLQ